MKSKILNLSSNSEANVGGKWTDVIRVGNWENSYKEFRITSDDLEKMVQNFNANVLGLDQGELQFNFSHMAGLEAAGWIEELRIENNTLQAKVRWTSMGKEKIEDEQFKYVSAEIAMNYQDDESGKKYGMTLTGAALTNIPFVRGMKAVALSEDKKDVDLYIFSNAINRMDKFKQLMSEFANKETLSQSEFAKIQGAFAMLSDEEQAEAQPEVDEAETKVEEEAKPEETETEKELSAAKEKIQVLEATNQDVVQLNARIQQLELDKATAQIDAELSALVQSGQILQKEVEANKNLALSLNEENRKQFLDTLKSRAKVINLGEEIGHGGEGCGCETAVKDGALDLSQYETEAKELMKTQKYLSLGAALTEVAKKHGAFDFLEKKSQ